MTSKNSVILFDIFPKDYIQLSGDHLLKYIYIYREKEIEKERDKKNRRKSFAWCRIAEKLNCNGAAIFDGSHYLQGMVATKAVVTFQFAAETKISDAWNLTRIQFL